MKDKNQISELSEEMELVGPGSMLAEARSAMGLSQQEVAKKLNFRVSLIIDIEAERFDKKLPETFNRGYLRNYARLVKLNVDEILTSYEVFHVAEKQGAEMLSFSRGTSIKAENKRIMWASYFILTALIASTVVWWVQDSHIIQETSTFGVITDDSNISEKTISTEILATPQDEVLVSNLSREEENSPKDSAENVPDTQSHAPELSIKSAHTELHNVNSLITENDTPAENIVAVANTVSEEKSVVEEVLLVTPGSVDIRFTFLGDCWVDIYDANGEHVAWGIKKEGYVMNISAIPPVAITLGKPELVSIVFEDSEVNMNKYSKGKIAKFTLPLTP